MKNKILLAGSLLVLVLVVGFLGWSYQKGNVKMFAIAPKISPILSPKAGIVKGTVTYMPENRTPQEVIPASFAYMAIITVCPHDDPRDPEYDKDCATGYGSTVTANEQGKYKIVGVPPSTGTRVYQILGLLINTNNIEYSAASSYFTLNGGETKTINLFLTTTEKSMIKGRIYDVATKNAIGGTVSIQQLFVSNPFTGSSSTNGPYGSYSIGPFEPGSYLVKVSSSGYYPTEELLIIGGDVMEKNFYLSKNTGSTPTPTPPSPVE